MMTKLNEMAIQRILGNFDVKTTDYENILNVFRMLMTTTLPDKTCILLIMSLLKKYPNLVNETIKDSYPIQYLANYSPLILVDLTRLFKAFLKHGADINGFTFENQTPVTQIVRKLYKAHQFECAEKYFNMFLNYGADLNIKMNVMSTQKLTFFDIFIKNSVRYFDDKQSVKPSINIIDNLIWTNASYTINPLYNFIVSIDDLGVTHDNFLKTAKSVFSILYDAYYDNRFEEKLDTTATKYIYDKLTYL